MKLMLTPKTSPTPREFGGWKKEVGEGEKGWGEKAGVKGWGEGVGFPRR